MEPLSHKWFLCIVKCSGAPPGSLEWILNTLKGSVDSTKFVDKGTIWQGLRCCICWQSPLYTRVKDHSMEGCPLLSSFNEMRGATSLVPVTPCRLGLSATMERLPVQVEDLAKESKRRDKELQETIKNLETRLSLVEEKAGITEPAAALEKRKKKNSKKDKAKGRNGGNSGVQAEEAANPVQSGSGRQKGKKKSAPPPSSSNTNVPSSISAWESD
jgi:hypothetical protein